MIANLDADAEKEIGSRFGVTGFPTIKFFPKDNKENPETYEQARDVQVRSPRCMLRQTRPNRPWPRKLST